MASIFCCLTVIFLGLIACSYVADAGLPCTDSSQCAADECCQVINIIVASKKRQLDLAAGPTTTGTCEKYSLAGASCNSFDVMNGYCGCARGLTCKTVYVGTTTSAPAPFRPLLQLRRPAPGYVSFCGFP